MRAENRWQIAKASLLFSFALTLAASGYSQTRADPRRAHKHETIPVHCEIPFRTYRDYLMVVQGSLGGKLRRNLIIDTNCSVRHSALSESNSGPTAATD